VVAVFAGLGVTRPWLLMVLVDLAYLVLLAQAAWGQRHRLT